MRKPRKKPLHPYLKGLGAEIKKIRTSMGISLEILGTDIGLDASNLQKIERGQNLTVGTLLKICICLNISPAKFFDKLTWELNEEDIDALTTTRTIKKKSIVKRGRKKK